MKIFSWVANKIGGKQEASRIASSSSGPSRANVSECRNDEFSDWPQSLLAIGTFGNKQIEEEAQVQNPFEDGQSKQDAVKFTEEEVDKIQKEFEMILASKDQTETYDSHDENDNEKQMDRLMKKKIIRSKSNDSLAKKRKTLKPRSVASLLKLLMRKGGFATAVPDPRNAFPQSRMEKLLKAILHTKIHPQNPSPLPPKRHLDWRPDEKEINECLEDALSDLEDDGEKWVKTDSDFIVLEM
uniref:Uncharacterized protein n=1 Tax=Avena sativa TaxID=4498 RepID=A0ACD5Y1M7_AVESA